VIRRLRRVGLACAVGLGAGVFLILTVPTVFGFRTYSVNSGSMAPAINAGDAVMTRSIPVTDARRGDVLTFPDPFEPDRLITHRVVRADIRGSAVAVTTRGDANEAAESWTADAEAPVGRMVLSIPRAGYVLGFLGGPAAQLGLVVLPTLALGIVALLRIWRPRLGGVPDHG